MPETATVQIAMPEMGESVTEGIVLEWHVAEGDFVNEGDTVVEVSTDKVDAEVPAPADGVITSCWLRSTTRCRWGRRWPRWKPARESGEGSTAGCGSCRRGRRRVLASREASSTPASSTPPAEASRLERRRPGPTGNGAPRCQGDAGRSARCASNGVDLGSVSG